MRSLLAVWAALILLNYALAPGHAATLDDLTGFFLPRHGAVSLSTWLLVWTSRGKAALVWLLLNAALLGAGLTTRRWLGIRSSLICAWLLGIAPFSLALLGLGLCGLWLKPLLAGCLLFSTVFLLSHRRTIARVRPTTGALLAVSPCLLALPAALAPETVFDALRYHLALPGLYLHEHKIFYVERFLFASFPATMEMLYGAALALGTTVSAKLLVWQCFVLSTLQLFAILRPRLANAHAVLLCAGFAAMPFLSSHAIFAGVDHPLICLELAAFAIILEQLAARRSRRAWLLVGWLLGTALGIKYLAGFAIFCAGLALTAVWRRTGALKSFLLVALPVAACLPLAWGLKNWLLTGNPVYPYLFGHMQIEPETFRLHLLWAEEWKQQYSWLFGWAKLFPISLTRGIYDSHGEALAPYLFMIVGLATVCLKPFGAPERWLLALSTILYVSWSHVGGGIYRYLAPLYPVATLLAGFLLSSMTMLPRAAVTWVLALSLAIQIPPLLTAHRRLADPSSLFAGAETERGYLHRVLPPHMRYLPAMERGCATAAGGRLYMLGDPKTFYAPCRCITEFELAPPLLHALARSSPTPARIRVKLKQRRITAILYSPGGMVSIGRMSGASLSGNALKRYQAFWRTYTQPIWAEDHPSENCFYQCYALRSAPGPFIPPDSQLWYLLPTTEQMTQTIDKQFDAGELEDALRGAHELVRREPDYAPGWYRLWLVSRKLGDRAAIDRAATRVKQLGFEALLTMGD